MTTFDVLVKEVSYHHWVVEASSEDEAMESYPDGSYVSTDWEFTQYDAIEAYPIQKEVASYE